MRFVSSSSNDPRNRSGLCIFILCVSNIYAIIANPQIVSLTSTDLQPSRTAPSTEPSASQTNRAPAPETSHPHLTSKAQVW